MAINIEAKVKIDSLQHYIHLLKTITGTEGIELNQEDIFFNIDKGALKYRQENNNTDDGHLIHYDRDYTEFPFISRYTREKTTKEKIAKVQETYGVKSIVKKKRLLFMVDNARVHLDDVYNLGSFVEIELVINNDKEIDSGRKIVQNLFNKLGLQEQNILYSTYESMLAEHHYA